MKSVAAYRGRDLAFGALGPLLMGLASAGVVLAVPYFIASEGSRGSFPWGLLIVAVMPLGLAWLFLSDAAQRLKASGEKDCFLKAGPEGLALRLPGKATRASAYFSYEMWDYSFRWDEVQTLSWTVESGSARNLVVTARGGSLEIPGRFFQEDSKKILDNIRAAAAPVQPPIPKTTL